MHFKRALLAAVLVCLPFASSGQGTHNPHDANQIRFNPTATACSALSTDVQELGEELCARIAAEEGGGGGGGGGSSIILDLTDDDANESLGVTEIAIVNASTVATMPAADKLHLDFGPLILQTEIDTIAEVNTIVADGNFLANTDFTTSGRALIATGSGTFTEQDVLQPTEVDTKAELNAVVTDGDVVTSIAADSGTPTTGTIVTFAGGTSINTTVSGDVITINSEVVAAETGSPEICGSGTVMGGGLDANGTLAWGCADYNITAVRGGTVVPASNGSALVGSWTTPTTSNGNAYDISCTGAGVGIGEDGATINRATNLALGGGTVTAGSTTTVVNDSNAGAGTNAFAGMVIRFTTLNGAPSTEERYIKSNTATAITVGVALSVAPIATDTYEIYNLYANACGAAGDHVKLFAGSDLMVMQDMIRPGGSLYFHEALGEPNLKLLANGCGRQTFGGATNDMTVAATMNNCPVLQAKNSGHFQRQLSMAVNGINWVGVNYDLDGFNDSDMAGMQGVWIINDYGGGGGAGKSDPTRYMDPASNGNGTVGKDLSDIAGRAIGLGGLGSLANVCEPASVSDPRCNVASATTEVSSANYQSYNILMDARSSSTGVPAHTTDVQDPTLFCGTDLVAVSPNQGVCEFDPTTTATATGGVWPGGRILCTTAGDNVLRTSATAGGCCFAADGTCDGEADDNDLGRCLSWVDFLDELVDGGGGSATARSTQVAISQNGQIHPGATYTSSVDSTSATVVTVPATATNCTNGGNFSLGTRKWPMQQPRFDTTSSPRLAIYNDTYKLGMVYGLNFASNDWYGRSTCLSASDIDGTDDEAGCDEGAPVSFLYGSNGVFDHIAVSHGAYTSSIGTGSTFDSTDLTFGAIIRDSVIRKWKRGPIADWAGVIPQRLLVENNYAQNTSGATMLNLSYNSNLIIDALPYSVKLKGNTADYGIAMANGRGGSLGHVMSVGNELTRGAIIVPSGGGGDLVIHDIDCVNDTACIVISNVPSFTPYNDRANLIFRNIRGRGYSNGATNGAAPIRALIAFTNLFNFAPTFGWRNVLIDGAVSESGADSFCTVAYGYDVDGGDEQVITNTSVDKIDLRNIWHDNIDGATGGKPVCAIDEDPAAAKTAANDVGVLTRQHIPAMHNIRLDGVQFVPDTLPAVAAATAPDADLIPVGSVVRIFDDLTEGACTDATSNGVLDGGGVAVSTCKVTVTHDWGIL